METAIGVAIGALITLLVSRYYFRRSTSKSLGVYRLLNSLVFSGIAPDVRRQLQFLFNTREVAELQQLVFLVANDGEKPIRDVIEPLTLLIPADVEVLDASIVHRHPEVLRAEIITRPRTPQGTEIRIEFPLLNKREFFVVKLLLSGAFRLEKSRFRILSDDLPRTVPISRLPYSAFHEEERKTEWGLAAAGATIFGFGGLALLFRLRAYERAARAFPVSLALLCGFRAVAFSANPVCASHRYFPAPWTLDSRGFASWW